MGGVLSSGGITKLRYPFQVVFSDRTSDTAFADKSLQRSIKTGFTKFSLTIL